jgi:hypothetical protein
LTFGLPQLELGVHAGRDPAAGDVDDVAPLIGGTLGDLDERVLPVQLDIGLCDGDAEHEARILNIESGRLGERLRAMHGVSLLAPEIEIPAQGRPGLAQPE